MKKKFSTEEKEKVGLLERSTSWADHKRDCKIISDMYSLFTREQRHIMSDLKTYMNMYTSHF